MTMITRITIAELRRRLPEGSEYDGEFLLTKFIRGGESDRQRRVVKKNTTSHMVSTFLTGPKIGKNIYLDWRGCTAVESCGVIMIRSGESDFLKITQITKAVMT